MNIYKDKFFWLLYIGYRPVDKATVFLRDIANVFAGVFLKSPFVKKDFYISPIDHLK